MMRTKRTNKSNDIDFWKNHIAAWKKSGLSQKAYCEREQIGFSSFKNQKNAFTDRQEKKFVNFIRVNPDIPPMKAAIIESSSQFEIVLPNGIQVVVSSPFESHQLKLVLQVAGSVQCSN